MCYRINAASDVPEKFYCRQCQPSLVKSHTQAETLRDANKFLGYNQQQPQHGAVQLPLQQPVGAASAQQASLLLVDGSWSAFATCSSVENGATLLCFCGKNHLLTCVSESVQGQKRERDEAAGTADGDKKAAVDTASLLSQFGN